MFSWLFYATSVRIDTISRLNRIDGYYEALIQED
jgi:hypothetical protein